MDLALSQHCFASTQAFHTFSKPMSSGAIDSPTSFVAQAENHGFEPQPWNCPQVILTPKSPNPFAHPSRHYSPPVLRPNRSNPRCRCVSDVLTSAMMPSRSFTLPPQGQPNLTWHCLHHWLGQRHLHPVYSCSFVPRCKPTCVHLEPFAWPSPCVVDCHVESYTCTSREIQPQNICFTSTPHITRHLCLGVNIVMGIWNISH